MRKRNHLVFFRLTAEELQHMNGLAERSGLHREEVLRSIVMGVALRAKPCPHYDALLHKAAGFCNNVTQLNHIATVSGTVDKESMAEMQQTAKEVWHLVKEKM